MIIIRIKSTISYDSNIVLFKFRQRLNKGFSLRVNLQRQRRELYELAIDGCMPGLAILDGEFGCCLGETVFLRSMDISVGLHNLADKRYHEHLADGVSGQELAAPGRGISLSLSGSF
ncbi:MAG: hypothetical protein RBR77_02635 [Thauera sp.]|jgi:hypothetical protein|nr:hypothetical protein [Thauera sp.]